jgi:hypothetical protein
MIKGLNELSEVNTKIKKTESNKLLNSLFAGITSPELNDMDLIDDITIIGNDKEVCMQYRAMHQYYNFIEVIISDKPQWDSKNLIVMVGHKGLLYEYTKFDELNTGIFKPAYLLYKLLNFDVKNYNKLDKSIFKHKMHNDAQDLLLKQNELIENLTGWSGCSVINSLCEESIVKYIYALNNLNYVNNEPGYYYSHSTICQTNDGDVVFEYYRKYLYSNETAPEIGYVKLVIKANGHKVFYNKNKCFYRKHLGENETIEIDNITNNKSPIFHLANLLLNALDHSSLNYKTLNLLNPIVFPNSH